MEEIKQSDFQEAPMPPHSRLATIGGLILWTISAIVVVLVVTRVVVLR